MRPSITITALSALTISLASAAQDPVLDAIPKVFGRAATSYTEFEKITGDSGKFPRAIEKDGSLKCVGPTDWTSGFYPGSLWMLYEYSGEPKWKAAALKSTNALESLRHFRDHHDVTPLFPASSPSHWLFQEPPAESKLLAATTHLDWLRDAGDFHDMTRFHVRQGACFHA